MGKNRLDFEAKLSRHPHDITGGFTSSLTPGCLVPQYWHVLNPGDTIYYNSKMFIRFKDVVTAFLGEVDVHLDYYFVPLQMLYLPFGQIFAQTDDVISSTFGTGSSNSTDKFPLLANLPHLNDEGNIDFGVLANPSSFYSGHNECIGKEITRLIEPLGFNPLAACANPTNPEEGIAPSYCINPLHAPWSFAAYQAIYQNFYRNDEFERFNISAYNVDQYYNVPNFVNAEFTKLRYVQRPSDYFTSVRVSPIASGVNRLGNSDSAGSSTLGDLLSKTRQFLGDVDLNPVSFDGSIGQTSFNDTSSRISRGFVQTASNIRTLFAVDKFLRVYGRAGKTYDDQILAHFGVKVPHDVKHQATKLASYHTAIGSDPVYATSTTGVESGSVLGQVGGQASGEIKVVGGQNGERGKYADKFSAPVHGVFMAVAYAVTKPRYTCTFNKLNLLTDRLSFPIPEFDKLGAQPLYLFETNPLSFGSSVANYGVRRIGWQNRYQEFKKKFNRASLNYLHDNGLLGSENNSFSAWVLSRSPFKDVSIQLTSDALILSDWLFERPDALNSVMSVQYDGTWHDEFFAHPHEILDTDPMIVEYQCEAKLISWMSETGEPDLGI